ncbi:DUF3866 family protein [Myceligenerans pegani]|uniref:DUF3866 family protein n=1 Tax=Myceligenerans pegani TaxID=2776917 RepID=A0ABR9MUW0_9MICO|nr:DUF3866 family protein [Myceligenerans sp. TRM 65318]MBE1874915.1 DUF3866 family protein [Myceligenerans sp. TRM 65318]MBE3017186.1 DUF3866 family protein [Myceligenerans sp. TRM 65318]
MITWRIGTVLSTGKRWRGATELTVTLDRPLTETPGDTPVHEVRALAYTHLVGDPEPGDALLVNVSALARGLGTGGYALVVGPASRLGEPLTDLPADPPPGPGHLVKARYTPLQTLVLGVDEQESPHHDTLRDADTLDGMPVVTADLHSALPAVIAGTRHAAALAGQPPPRIAYVMTDGGALPAAFSRTVAALREAQWLDTCITAGQAYGGDLESVTVHTGLLAAHHVAHADIAVVVQGPGNLGTGTRWGYSGVAAGEAVNATAALGGHPVASLRVSGADPRPRHRGISHHSLTAYARVALAAADVPVPDPAPGVEAMPGWGGDLTERVREQAATLAGRHRLIDVAADDALVAVLRTSPAGLRTMGRGLDEDPASFVAAAVAGIHAQRLVTGPATGPVDGPATRPGTPPGARPAA